MCVIHELTWKIASVSQIPRYFESEINQVIETNCQSVAYTCQDELGIHARNIPAKMYKRIQYGVNNRINSSFKALDIHVNNVSLVKESSGDGVLWSGADRGRVKSKFKETIKGFIGTDEDDE